MNDVRATAWKALSTSLVDEVPGRDCMLSRFGDLPSLTYCMKLFMPERRRLLALLIIRLGLFMCLLWGFDSAAADSGSGVDSAFNGCGRAGTGGADMSIGLASPAGKPERVLKFDIRFLKLGVIFSVSVVLDVAIVANDARDWRDGEE